MLFQVFPLADSVTRVIYDEGISNSVNMSQTDLETGTNLLLGALGSCRILFSHLSEVKGDLQDACKLKGFLKVLKFVLKETLFLKFSPNRQQNVAIVRVIPGTFTTHKYHSGKY